MSRMVPPKSWGYEVYEVHPGEAMPKCGAKDCRRPGCRHVLYVQDDRALAEKFLCTNHGPAEDRLYEGLVAA